jgi:hypothetical protein
MCRAEQVIPLFAKAWRAVFLMQRRQDAKDKLGEIDSRATDLSAEKIIFSQFKEADGEHRKTS